MQHASVLKPQRNEELAATQGHVVILKVGSLIKRYFVILAVEQVAEVGTHRPARMEVVAQSGIQETVYRVMTVGYLEDRLREVGIQAQFADGVEVHCQRVVGILQQVVGRRKGIGLLPTEVAGQGEFGLKPRKSAPLGGKRGVQGMVAGQVADLASEKSGARDMDTLRFIHVNKTGAMIRASLLAGGCVAGADEEQLKALSDFGYAYGDLFQMTDDILDVEGSFESMGKTLGKDAQEGKLTYISLVGLEEAKKIAGQTAENALAALEIFGEKAWLLRELTNATLSRKS